MRKITMTLLTLLFVLLPHRLGRSNRRKDTEVISREGFDSR
jgi:hypothetical protein